MIGAPLAEVLENWNRIGGIYRLSKKKEVEFCQTPWPAMTVLGTAD